MHDRPMNGSAGTPQSSQRPAKKPYQPPVLTRLGSLRELTMTKRSAGSKDGKNNRFTGRAAGYR